MAKKPAAEKAAPAADKSASKKKYDYPKFISPRGVWNYPALHEASKGSKDYPDPDGSYKVDLMLEADDKLTKGLLAKLEPLAQEALEKAKEEWEGTSVANRKKFPKGPELQEFFTVEYDDETEKPTGRIRIRAKMKASGAYKEGHKKFGKRWNMKPDIFDGVGNVIKKVPPIWSGSEGKISFEVSPYYVPAQNTCGISFKLKAAQVLKLQTGSARSASDHGFEKEEDGFEYDENAFVDETAEKPSADTSEEDDDGGEF
jgi:hypothetical protein